MYDSLCVLTMQCDVSLQFFSCGDFVKQVNKGPVEGKLSVLCSDLFVTLKVELSLMKCRKCLIRFITYYVTSTLPIKSSYEGGGSSCKMISL